MNPIIVYCANQKEMDNWFGLLKDQIEANGGTAITAETYTEVITLLHYIGSRLHHIAL